MSAEAQAARRLYLSNWVPIGLMTVLLVVCLACTDFSIQIDRHLALQFGTAVGLAIAADYAFSHNSTRLSYIFGSMALFIFLSLLATSLSFVVAALEFPLQDAYLGYLDDMLGLDWRAYLSFIYAHPLFIPYLDFGYAMITSPIYVVPIALSVTHQHLRLQQFVFASILSVMIIVLVSAVVPAMGTFYEYGIAPDMSKLNPGGYIAQLDRLPLVRDGSLRILNSVSLGGIISFPSLHAAAPIVSLWALWSIRWMRPLVLICCIDLLLATPVFGGHYFVDIFAGIVVAVVAIFVAQRVAGFLVRSTTAPVRFVAPQAA